MKLLRMRMMKPYICLMGGNGVFCEQVLQGGVGVGGGGGRRCRVNVDPPSTPPASSSSSTGSAAGSSKHIKLIKPDGVVTIFQKPIKASELMEEYPKHMVCRSDSFYIGQKIPHLSQQDKLQRGNTYFLLPSHIFHSVLSFVTIASFASPQRPPHPQSSIPSQLLKSPAAAVTANSTTSTSVVLGSSSSSKREEHEEQMKSRAALLKKAAGSSRSSSSPPAFDIQKTKSGTLRIRVSEVFISQLIMDQQDQEKKQLIDQEEDDEMKKRVLCTTPQLHKDYKQLVMGSRVRHWKPKLDMISEAAAIPKEKRKTLLSSASFGIKSKKSQLPHQQDDHDQPKTRPVTAAPKVLQQHDMISETAAIPKEKRKALLSSASFGIKRKKKSSSKSTKKSQLPQHQHQHDHDQIKTRHAAAHDHAAPPLLQQNDIINPPPKSQSLSTTKSPSTCKLRRFKLKLRGLTASTTSPSRSTCKSRKHLQHSSA